jgi:tetratricopeptide (TPR) repeat protein
MGGAALRAMKKVAPTWYVQIAPPSAEGSSVARLLDDVHTASQERMKRELGAFLQEVSQQQPLVLFLDDLHWADVSTVDLLAYLATKLPSMRLLIVATYRTSDLLLSKHPFLKVKLDLQGRGVCHDVALDFLSRADVDRYLDLTFPGHRFAPELPALIHTKTEGSPLFIVDLVRYLRDRGVIAEDDGGARLAKSLPDVARELPESIRSMIERKIEQLSAPDRRLLLSASVQGYEFDSAVLSAILEEDPADVEERLELLDRVHTFVRLTQEEVFPDGTPTVRYRFVHVLYQNALYASLRPTRRVLLSKAVAEALLGHYKERSGEVAAELAHLFDAARDVERAVDFFLLAAQRAADVFAYQEATSLARRGLELVPSLPLTPERAQKELLLNLTAGFSLSITKGSATPEMGESMQRARAICEHMGEVPQLFPVIWGLWAYYVVGAELPAAREMAEKTLRLAQAVNDPVMLVGAHYAMGTTLRFLGQLAESQAHHEQMIALDNPQYSSTYSRLYKLNPRLHGQSETAHALWVQGYPDRARRRLDETLTLARADRDPRSLAHAQLFGAMVQQACGDVEKTRELADACVAHCNDHGIAQERDWVSIWRGWAISEQGRAEEGIAMMRESLSTIRARRAEVVVALCVLPLADALIKNGRIDDGLGVIEEALSLVRSNGERSHEPELHRLKADLLLMRGDDTLHGEAEACFEKAIDSARSQKAQSFELRAVMGLCRLRERQGRAEEARHMLSEIYGWFTEGFETRDLQQARELSQSLAKPG